MVFDRVRKLISEQLEIDEDTVSETSDLISDLEADSLDIVQMLIQLEQEFGLEFEDEEIKTIHTVGDVVRFIETKKK